MDGIMEGRFSVAADLETTKTEDLSITAWSYARLEIREETLIMSISWGCPSAHSPRVGWSPHSQHALNPGIGIIEICWGVWNYLWYIYIYMDVPKIVVPPNSGTPKSSILIGFSIKPSILGYPFFWKHPYDYFAALREQVWKFARPLSYPRRGHFRFWPSCKSFITVCYYYY